MTLIRRMSLTDQNQVRRERLKKLNELRYRRVVTKEHLSLVKEQVRLTSEVSPTPESALQIKSSVVELIVGNNINLIRQNSRFWVWWHQYEQGT